MEVKKINWPGLADGLATLALVIFSLSYASPWWHLTVGQQLGEANVSPLNFNFTLFGASMTPPIAWFLNISCQLSLIASAVAMLISSFASNKEYSKNLINFAYKKPLIVIIIFLIFLSIAIYIAGTLLQINVPLSGSTITTLDAGPTTIDVPITTEFTWIFWLAIAAAILCIAAKLYHKKLH